MSNVICVKCGMKGNSKCPETRHVFVMGNDPDLELAEEMLTYTANFGHDEVGKKTITIGCDPFKSRQGESYLDILERMKRILCLVDDLKPLACIHKWEFAVGEHCEVNCPTHAQVEPSHNCRVCGIDMWKLGDNGLPQHPESVVRPGVCARCTIQKRR